MTTKENYFHRRKYHIPISKQRGKRRESKFQETNHLPASNSTFLRIKKKSLQVIRRAGNSVAQMSSPAIILIVCAPGEMSPSISRQRGAQGPT